ncbi:MAG: glycosyltransferase family 4 protein [Bdellovibrionota bacterium]|nr:MAG: glycosyltransferase family 4 protein [Bdellovibrionota bacterium]
MASILVLGVKVPFTRGGADALVHSLIAELRRRGHDADSIELPFQVWPKEVLLNQVAMWRAIDFQNFAGKQVDLVIATKFPSYFARHPRKSLWLVHQHRPLYELYAGRYSDFSDDPRDEELRALLSSGDGKAIAECQCITGISKNVVERLRQFNGIDGTPLYPPLPLGDRYRTAPGEDFVLSVGRLCAIKRVDLMIKALPIVHRNVHLKVVGTPDEPGILDYFNNEIAKHHLQDRVEFLGRVDDATLLDLYARCRAVYYGPHDEDYGYVTLEAMASAKPVVTTTDSGGVLEFVQHEEQGLVVAPTTDAIGHAVNRLIEDPALASRLGAGGRQYIESSGLASSGWDNVVSTLLSPLHHAERALRAAENEG